MGRTIHTFTDLIQRELKKWTKFRYALRKEDQQAFDEMFRSAKLHVAENFYMMPTVPFESIAISILLEQQKEIKRLQELIRE